MSSNLVDDQTAELFERIQTWHKSRIEQLNKILAHKEADLKIADINIKAGSDTSKGLRIGILLAVGIFGDLPFTIEPLAQSEDEL